MAPRWVHALPVMAITSCHLFPLVLLHEQFGLLHHSDAVTLDEFKTFLDGKNCYPITSALQKLFRNLCTPGYMHNLNVVQIKGCIAGDVQNRWVTYLTYPLTCFKRNNLANIWLESEYTHQHFLICRTSKCFSIIVGMLFCSLLFGILYITLYL